MTRERYINKMTALMVAIHKDAVSKGRNYNLGESLKHLKTADLTKALNEYGRYSNIWNSKVVMDLRKCYGL